MIAPARSSPAPFRLRLSAWICAAVALVGVAAAGCGQAPRPTNTLIYGRGEDANTLDPVHTDIGEAVNVIVNLFDTLVTYDDETTELVPSLATGWEHSADGLTWTFQLREGVQFHDGTPLTAAAVKFSFDRLIGPVSGADPGRPYRPSYLMIDRVEAPDERTVVFRLKEPSAIFLKNLTMFPASIVSPAAVEQHGADFAERPVGTGPFRFVKWARDQQLVLAAFEQHWRGRPALDHLVFVPVKENATRVEQLTRGEIHIADNLPPPDLDLLAHRPELKVQEAPAMNVAYLTLQTEKPPLGVPAVRQAIWQAIDKAALVRVAYGGHARPAVSVVPPTMWGHHDGLEDRPYDPAAAKRLLEAAAAEHGFALPLRLTLAVMSQPRPYLQQPLTAAGFIKDALREIGVEVTVQPRDVNQHFEHVMAGRHELGLAGWSSDNNDPDNFLYSLLDPDNIGEQGNNLSRFRHDRLHELLLAGQRELDDARRLALYREAQEIVLAEAPVVPLAHTSNRVAQSRRVQGYRLHPTGLVRLRLAHFEDAP